MINILQCTGWHRINQTIFSRLNSLVYSVPLCNSLSQMSEMHKLIPVLQVLKPRSFLFQSDDTGDHLDGGRMLWFGCEEAGLNLAGDNNGRSRWELELSAAAVCWWAEVSTDKLAHSDDIPNGPAQLQTFMYNTKQHICRPSFCLNGILFQN